MTIPTRPRGAGADDAVLEALGKQDFSRENLSAALGFQGEAQAELFALARARRGAAFPAGEVEVRSVVEISNVCTQQCEYCGMGQGDSPKYVLPEEEFVQVAAHLYAEGRRVLLVQAGENRSPKFIDHVCRCIRAIKALHPDLEIILCLGNLSYEQFRELRAAGAERYILKYETANPELYHRLKPRDSFPERVACLEHLLELGFKVGSGNIVGLPGQTREHLVDDLVFAGRFPLAMVSCSVFIPGEASKLHKAPIGDPEMALNTLALMRLMYSQRLIPTTSPFERVKKDGQFFGLMAGANTVTIHDGTPDEFRKLFPIYSGRRFTPNGEHIRSIVKRAGLRLGKGSLI